MVVSNVLMTCMICIQTLQLITLLSMSDDVGNIAGKVRYIWRSIISVELNTERMLTK